MNTKLRQRFVKDYNLPINIFDEEMFNYYKELYDFFPTETWDKLNDMIKCDYRGNVDVWLDYCAEFRDRIIDYISHSDEFLKFNTMDLSEYTKDRLICGEKSYYTEETDGKIFLSIDLKKANFQALKYVGVIKENTYDELMDKFCANEYIKNSKYLRQVIFGKMNPGRTITIEKYIMAKIHNWMKYWYKNLNEFFTLYSANSDELVYELNIEKYNEFLASKPHDTFIVNIAYELREAEIIQKRTIGIDIRCELVKIERLPIVNCNDSKVDAFVRKNIVTGESVLKKASTTFYPQIYKLWKGMEIEDRDLMVYFDDQLAKFLKPLILKEK